MLYLLCEELYRYQKEEITMAIHQIVHSSMAIAKDASVDRIDVTLDTSKWSKRKQNIICKAVNSGVADCGWETASFVTALTKSYGLGTQRLHTWNQGLKTSMIRPDKVDEVCAYLAAMIKMREDSSWLSWLEDSFLESLDKGEIPKTLPMPKQFSKAENAKFVDDYLKDQDEQEQLIRHNLINTIRNGSKVTISYTI